MELTPAQRKLTFVVIVLVLVALGAYLFVSHGSEAGKPAAAPSSQPSTRAPAPPAPSQPPASQPPAADVTQNTGIYQLLPFTPQGLASAETIAVRFGVAYGSYSYTEPAAAYVATMKSFISADLRQQIAEAYSTPGVASQRASQKQVASATARVTALRAFGPTSLTFVLEVSQQITATTGGGPVSTGYAVTLTGGDTTWQVTDIELATAGQF
jgi:hypothetical protein